MPLTSDLPFGRCLEWTTTLPSCLNCSRNSPAFCFQGNEWWLQLSLDKSKRYYVIHIENGKGRNVHRFEYRLNVERRKGKEIHPIVQYGGANGSKYFSLLGFEDSAILKSVPDFGDNDPLTIAFIVYGEFGSTLSLVRETENCRTVQQSPCLNTDPCLESLSQDFSRLLDARGHPPSDVRLKCGDHTLQAHSTVLGARSEVFAAMLKTDMAEGRTGLVELQDTDADIFQDFVRYLYTGTIDELTVDTAKKFYEAGDKYAVGGLVRRCSKFLTENLTLENACETLALSDAHSDQGFKESVIAYILDKKIPLVDDHWLPFCDSRPMLAIEVYKRLYKLHCSN